MPTCPACEDNVETLYDCRQCGGSFCVDCRLPDEHSCTTHDQKRDYSENPKYRVQDVNALGLWKYPIYSVIAGVLSIIAFLGSMVVLSFILGTYDHVVAGAFIISMIPTLAAVGFALATYQTFWTESKMLKKSDSEWQPSAWLYIIPSLIASPVAMGLIYVFNRYRHIGLQ